MPEGSLTVLDVFSMCVNSAIGAGILAVPWVFLNIGLYAGVLFCLIFYAISTLSSLIAVENITLCETLKKMKEDGFALPPFFKKKSNDELVPFYMKIHDHRGRYEPQIENEPMPFSMQMYYVYGTPGKIIYTIFMLMTFECAMGAHVAVFASSITRYVPIFTVCNVYDYDGIFNDCRNIYLLYVALYLVIVVTLTLVGLAEQKVVQIISTLLRYMIFALMLVTAIASIATDTPLLEVTQAREYPSFTWEKLGISLPIIAFAAGYAICIPDLCSGLKNKKNAVFSQFIASVGIFLIVSSLGIIASYALLGAKVPSQTTLSWTGYDAGISPRPVWTYIIELVILLFPALNVMSCSPLIAIPVAGNYLQFFPNQSKKNEIICRLITWIPPAIIAFFTHDLGIIGALSGIPGYFIYFGFSFLISVGVKAKVDIPSTYGGFSNKYTTWICLIFCTMCTLFNASYIGHGQEV